MSLEYSAVQWNRQKRLYELALTGGVGAFLLLFGVVTKLFYPLVTDEILFIRAFGAAAFVLLHVILCIGPLCRLNKTFLPLLYNRRHAGVTMCLLALIHGTVVVITYHGRGDVNQSPTAILHRNVGRPTLFRRPVCGPTHRLGPSRPC
jgi:methionine sulfoxide reductase heme-binding subunit